MEYFEHQNTPATESHVIYGGWCQCYLWQCQLVYFGFSAADTSCEELSCSPKEGSTLCKRISISDNSVPVSWSTFILWLYHTPPCLSTV
jgi:hypothetical protein